MPPASSTSRYSISASERIWRPAWASCKVEERADVDLPVPRRGRRPSPDLVPPQHVLHADEKIGQALGRDGHVFDHRHRPAGSLDPVERRLEAVGQLPEQLDLRGSKAWRTPNAAALRLPHFVHQSLQALPHFQRIAPFQLHQQRGLDLPRNQRVQAGVRLAAPGSSGGGPSGRTPWARRSRSQAPCGRPFPGRRTATGPRRGGAAAAGSPGWPR